MAMIAEIPNPALPNWLATLDQLAVAQKPIPLASLLNGCFYYPSSGTDGDPMKFLAGNVHSFIYVDYGKKEQEILDRIERPGFCGYRVLARRCLRKEDLVPPHGWMPRSPTADDGDLSRVPREAMANPWGSWWVFERLDGLPETHGPRRFSLIFICGDGVATYQALFHGNNCVPLIVAIVQPGTGFGGNWTDYRESGKIFHRSVMSLNQAGQPQFLLYGGWGKKDHFPESCWPEFTELAWEHHGQRQLGNERLTDVYLGLWERQT